MLNLLESVAIEFFHPSIGLDVLLLNACVLNKMSRLNRSIFFIGGVFGKLDNNYSACKVTAIIADLPLKTVKMAFYILA